MSPCRSLGGPSAPGGRQRQCRQAWSGWNEATKPPRSDCLAVRTPPNAPATYIWRTNARGTMRTQPRPGRRGQPRAGRRGRSCAGRRGRNRARDDANNRAPDDADATARGTTRTQLRGTKRTQLRGTTVRGPPDDAAANAAAGTGDGRRSTHSRGLRPGRLATLNGQGTATLLTMALSSF